MDEEAPARPVEIEPGTLSREALAGLIFEFVTRDGTDYGAVERSVDEKSARVRAQLESGEARIVYDSDSETANIVLARDLEA